jgi:hypothetical protein
LDFPHQSSDAYVYLSKFDDDVEVPNLDLSISKLNVQPLIDRMLSEDNPKPVAHLLSVPLNDTEPAGTVKKYRIYIEFPNDAQPRANTASPYAGGYRLTLTAAPVDGSKTLTAPVNFSYIDSREQEQ